MKWKERRREKGKKEVSYRTTELKPLWTDFRRGVGEANRGRHGGGGGRKGGRERGRRRDGRRMAIGTKLNLKSVGSASISSGKGKTLSSSCRCDARTNYIYFLKIKGRKDILNEFLILLR